MLSQCIPFDKIRNIDLPSVGGKNASLGEMIKELSSLGIKIPDGFAVSADAFRVFIKVNQLIDKLKSELDRLDTVSLDNLAEIGSNCRSIMATGKFPEEMRKDIIGAYNCSRYHQSGLEFHVA